MNLNFKSLLRGLAGALGRQIATPETDPQGWLRMLPSLPNPDPILREMGQAEKVYYSICTDPHVLGDLRSIRGNFRSHDYRLLAGDEGDGKSMAALELCIGWLQRCQPNHISDWLDVMWQMSSAFLTGYRPHEVVWSLQGGKYLPEQVIDRPGRRFRFDVHGHPLLLTLAHPVHGEPIEEPYQFVISRHMADSVNPYGVAVLSSCFWPWTFKTGGWRYFVKYCERHGLPWPVGRYPLGTTDEDQDKLAKALGGMMEAGYVVAPEGTGLELLVPSGNGAGGLPQQHLIDLANREMSKAMTGQAMVAELQGAGARAASETAMKRQESIDDSVRDIAAQSMGAIFRWITLFNLGDGVAPPRLEFYQHQNAGKDRAETYQVAANLGARPSRSAMLQELGIPEAEDDADALLATTPMATDPAPLPSAPGAAASDINTLPTKPGTNGTRAEMTAADLQGIAGFEFARAAGMTDDEALTLASDAADQAIEDHMIAPVAEMLARFEADGKTLADFHGALQDLIGVIDDEALREVIDRSLTYSILRGAATRAA